MRVVIVEDQVLLREGLASLFWDRGHAVVAAVGDAVDIASVVARQPTDLVLVDVRLPPTWSDEGARAARELKDARPDLGVLVLSQHVDHALATSMLGLPGFGYLLKDRVLHVEDFLEAAARVVAGGSALDTDVVATLLRPAELDDPLASLSERERVVLGLMAEGLNNPAIARRLVLSERTVEGHVRHVLLKLGLGEAGDGHRRVQAVLAHLSAHGGHR